MRPLGDEVLVRRAARGVAGQTAALVALAMLALVALVTLVIVQQQQGSRDTLLRTTTATADDVGDPPAGAWIVLVRGGSAAITPGLPEEVGPRLAALRDRPTGQAVLRTVATDEGDFRVATQQRGEQVVQVVLDLRPQQDERDRLFRVMGVAAVASVLVAAGVGALVGRRAVRPLAQALALQREFVAQASHELRTPLTLLSTRAQLLDSGLRTHDVDPQVLEDARGIVADAQRLGGVVEDLLAAADPRRPGLEESVDVGALVSAAGDSARAHARAAGVELTVAPPDRAYAVQGSGPALRRAVLALVDNAVDHTGPGGQVALSVRGEHGTVVLAVRDSGAGSGRDPLRAHYGLGLALTHDVVNRLGGQLRQVPAGVGTTYELVLPTAGPPRKHQEAVGTL